MYLKVFYKKQSKSSVIIVIKSKYTSKHNSKTQKNKEKESIKKKKLENLEEKTKNSWKSKQINLKYVYII